MANLLSILFSLLLVLQSSVGFAQTIAELDAKRAQAIAKALGVDASRVLIKNGTGKVDADQTHKLAYFIFTNEPASAAAETVLVPLATSRFDEYNYATDEWWDSHKEEIAKARERGLPPPKQDPAEVRAFLRANNLSTNPDVVIVRPGEGAAEGTSRKTKLQDYLIDYFIKRAGTDTHVTVFRGAEKQGELESWKKRQFPRGVRYWTPDATYAWRYARKNPNLIPDMVRGEAPLFKFRIPKETFASMVRNGDLVLGCEMTKKAHEMFARNGQFVDHLAEGGFYMGDGTIGLEVEIRGARGGRDRFAQFFEGAITVEDLAKERKSQIDRGVERLKRQYPDKVATLDALKAKRVARIDAESEVLIAIRDRKGAAAVNEALSAMPGGTPEMTNVDSFDISSFARSNPDGVAPKGVCGKMVDGLSGT